MLYIVTHKECAIQKMEGYVPLLVGAFRKASQGYLRDDSGENISEKNQNYCELTGLYWIWKNTNDKYAGIVHYRRFFSRSRIKKAVYPIEQLNEMLQKHDVIVTYKEHIRFSLRRQLVPSHCSREVFAALRNSIATLYPEYLEIFDRVFGGNTMSICNMMYCRKAILDRYCKWLFDILEATEKVIEEQQLVYLPRLYGYFGERLMNVWIAYSGLKTIRLPIVNIEQSLFMRIEKVAVTYISEILFRTKKILHIPWK